MILLSKWHKTIWKITNTNLQLHKTKKINKFKLQQKKNRENCQNCLKIVWKQTSKNVTGLRSEISLVQVIWQFVTWHPFVLFQLRWSDDVELFVAPKMHEYKNSQMTYVNDVTFPFRSLHIHDGKGTTTTTSLSQALWAPNNYSVTVRMIKFYWSRVVRLGLVISPFIK